jgi:hypothetical protein
MKARDLKPLPNPIPVREGGKILDRLNDLLAIVQQMEGPWPCLMPNVAHDCALNCRLASVAPAALASSSSATVDVMQALKDVIDRHLELIDEPMGLCAPYVSDACMRRRLATLFRAAKAADVWPHAAIGAD